MISAKLLILCLLTTADNLSASFTMQSGHLSLSATLFQLPSNLLLSSHLVRRTMCPQNPGQTVRGAGADTSLPFRGECPCPPCPLRGVRGIR